MNPKRCPKCLSKNIQSVELLRGGCASYRGDFQGYTEVWWDDSASIYWMCLYCEHEWQTIETEIRLQKEIEALLDIKQRLSEA